ncbi:MAG: ribbon-helix-helix domain-containing protein [Bosea sp. (in: a-proteobacteria)]
MSGVRKRSLSIRGHSTSVSLEEPFWEALREIAAEARQPLAVLVAEIDAGRGADNLSSALRLHVLAHFRHKNRPPDNMPPA